MSKISYPENESINSLTLNTMNDTLRSLNNANNQFSYKVPSDFQCLNALKEISAKLNNHMNELTNIHNKIVGIDKAFAATMDSLDATKDSLNTDVIDERDRLIK